MQKVDVAILVMGGVAVVATVLGVVFFDEIQGEQEFNFPTEASDLEMRGPEAVGAGGTEFLWDTPDNATAARLDIVVRLAEGSRVVSGGTANVQIIFTAPDGSKAYRNETWSIGQAASAGEEMEWSIEHMWHEAPNGTSAVKAELNETVPWDEPMRVEVRVEAPAEGTAALEQYNFEVEASGEVDTYRAKEQTADPSVP